MLVTRMVRYLFHPTPVSVYGFGTHYGRFPLWIYFLLAGGRGDQCRYSGAAVASRTSKATVCGSNRATQGNPNAADAARATASASKTVSRGVKVGQSDVSKSSISSIGIQSKRAVAGLQGMLYPVPVTPHTQYSCRSAERERSMSTLCHQNSPLARFFEHHAGLPWSITASALWASLRRKVFPKPSNSNRTPGVVVSPASPPALKPPSFCGVSRAGAR